MWRILTCLSIFFAMLPVTPNAIAEETSAYTKLDLNRNCRKLEEYEQGVTLICDGYRDYPVYFSEGDLRQMVRFGEVRSHLGQWESFGEFNHVNDTIEWRLEKGEPFATILRWFIENTGEDGNVSAERKGQVLVVSTVGTSARPGSCVVGYVDARANSNANELARELADTKAREFRCIAEKAEFSGKRGRFSGNPTSYFE